MQAVNKYGAAFWFVVGCLVFIPFIGNVHLFDWDEINFAECAREMIVSNNFAEVQINFEPFWEKPPLFIWLQALSMLVFGVTEFAARFPNAIIGALSLGSIYYFLRKTYNPAVGHWGAFLWLCSWLPHLYAKSGIIDPLFNLCIFSALILFETPNTYFKKTTIAQILSALFLIIAVLTKGPVALLIFALCWLVLRYIQKDFLPQIKPAIFLAAAILFGLGVLVFVEYQVHGFKILNEFITYQIRLLQTKDAGHGGFFGYHFIVLLIGCFPLSVFYFYSRNQPFTKPAQHTFYTLMQVLFWVVLILFSVVKTKIVHYSSLCYLPLTCIAAHNLYAMVQNQKVPQSFKIFFGIIASVWVIIVTIIPVAGKYIKLAIPYTKDVFAIGNMQAHVPWHYTECLFGVTALLIVLLCYYLWYIKQTFWGFVLFGICNIFLIESTLVHFVPKIEAYSQNAAIQFYKSKATQNAQVNVHGYKSYAHLFYANKNPNIKPTTSYTVSKINSYEQLITDSSKQLLYTKNGFAFWISK